MALSTYRLSVDIGGTFTDLVALDETTGSIRTLKVSSTPRDPSEAVLKAVQRARDEWRLDLGQVSQFTHASTVGSNILLEGRGAKTALLSTEGFRDVLEIQRHKRFRLFDQAYRKIQPLVPRRWALGIPERIDAAGAVLRPLDEKAVADVARFLGEEGVEAIGICFLFSFKNADHEQRTAEIVGKILPDCFITCSSDVYPQFREYERASTTVVNAYLGPRLSRYLQRMSEALTSVGIKVPLHLMQSNGGVISWTEASRMPCRVVESGPAAGAIAAAHFGGLAGRKNLISFDMGGTTAKAGLIENGELRQTAGQEVGGGMNVTRLLQGGGYFVGAATVDLAEVGAGGGSIAWIDGGVLKVGPKSAGADPGPIAYGIGGENVTVTDANLLLGRIPSDWFLGGEMTLDLTATRRAVEQKLAAPLGIGVDEACSAVVEVANANMLKLLRIVSVEKGFDPGDFTLVAFGGNGPVHGGELADDLGIHEVVIPPAPGVLSAQGLLVADVRYDFRQTYIAPVTSESVEEVERLFADLEGKGREALRRYGLGDKSVVVTRSADMRYRRQAYEITVPLPEGELTRALVSEIIESFHLAHEKLYGRRDLAATVEFVTLNLTAKGDTVRPEYKPLPKGDGSVQGALKQTRAVYFRDKGRIDCKIYDRAQLRAGDELSGPAIVEAPDSTTIVLPDWNLRCDSIGSLILTRGGSPS